MRAPRREKDRPWRSSSREHPAEDAVVAAVILVDSHAGKPRLPKEPLHAHSLTHSQLDGENASGMKEPWCASNDAPDHLESVCAAGQSDLWLESADVEGQRSELTLGNVRGIGGHEIELESLERGERFEEV